LEGTGEFTAQLNIGIDGNNRVKHIVSQRYPLFLTWRLIGSPIDFATRLQNIRV
jgi:hypothetical protein